LVIDKYDFNLTHEKEGNKLCVTYLILKYNLFFGQLA
jgi:hypothetical protein